jgi:formylglycine-generating enzyme
MEDKSYRLPTEAEWEYACRAGTVTEFSCGDTLGVNEANFGNSSKRTTVVGLSKPQPEPKPKPNGFGLYDMHGNVWELCSDLYSDQYFADCATKFPQGVIDPRGPQTGSHGPVMRGGCWFNSSATCSSAYRMNPSIPETRSNGIGFRVVLEIE